LWQSVLLVEENGAPGENHWPAISHWQTLSHKSRIITQYWEYTMWIRLFNAFIFILFFCLYCIASAQIFIELIYEIFSHPQYSWNTAKVGVKHQSINHILLQFKWIFVWEIEKKW
jgi:hypothetical protein